MRARARIVLRYYNILFFIIDTHGAATTNNQLPETLNATAGHDSVIGGTVAFVVLGGESRRVRRQATCTTADGSDYLRSLLITIMLRLFCFGFCPVCLGRTRRASRAVRAARVQAKSCMPGFRVKLTAEKKKKQQRTTKKNRPKRS